MTITKKQQAAWDDNLRLLAATITNDLMSSVYGEGAKRLVLTRADGLTLGGWSKGPLRNRIAMHLEGHLKPGSILLTKTRRVK